MNRDNLTKCHHKVTNMYKHSKSLSCLKRHFNFRKGCHLPENGHEKLQDYSRQNDERDGCSMNFLVDFAWFINEEYVVSIHVMLGNEIQNSKWSDKRTTHTEHHGHAEEKHHSSILFSKSELVFDIFPDCWNVGFAS